MPELRTVPVLVSQARRFVLFGGVAFNCASGHTPKQEKGLACETIPVHLQQRSHFREGTSFQVFNEV